MTRIQATLLRVGAAVTLVGLVVIPPVLVALLIGRPYPEWSTLTDEVQSGRVSADTVMRIAAVLFVAIWIWLVATIARETFRLLRGRGVDPGRSRRVAAPAVRRSPTFVHRLVRIAVLGTVTTATTISTWPTVALASSGASLAGSLDPEPPISAPADPTESAPSAPQTTAIVADGRATPLSIAVDLGDETLRDDIVAMNRTATWTGGVFPAGTVVTVPVVAVATESVVGDVYVVQPNDGLWDVADAFLGDGSRHHELRPMLHGQEVAPGVTFDASVDTIHPGWTFQRPSMNGESAALSPTLHVVQPGDTLSGISEQHLGTPDRWTDLWDLNGGAAMSDGRTFDDPDLILPGWTIDLPSVDEAGGASVEGDSASPSTPIIESAPTDPEPLPPPTIEAPSATVDLPATEEPVSESADAPASPPRSPSTVPPAGPSPELVRSEAPTAADSASAAAPSIFTDEERSVWPTVAAGSLLTVGLAAFVARLRRRRLSQLEPGRRLKSPTIEQAGTEHALLTRSAEHDLSTITALLRSITPYAKTHGKPPAVRAVQLGDERIEVLLADPAPDPPKGWTTIDGGHSWTHRLDEPIDEHRQLLTPALVTIGTRTDESADEVLLDLETAGTLAIVGDRSASIGLARSIVYELATYPLDVSMDVNLVGIDVPGAEHCDRTWIDTTIDRAVRVAARRAKRRHAENAAPIDRRAELDEDDGSTDPQVFIVDDAGLSHDEQESLASLVELCWQSSGVIAVLLGDVRSPGERIIASPGGTGLWSGVDLRLPNVSDEAADEIEDLVKDLATAETELIEPADFLAATAIGVAGDEGGAESDAESGGYVPPDYDVLVRLMGEPRVEGVDLTADETELLALLTCLRDRTEIHIGLIHESIAPERARKTIENRMSILRRKLGVGSDGHDLLPEAAPGNHGRSHYLVSPLVVTDVDLLDHRTHGSLRVDSAASLKVLVDGMRLVVGPLLQARRGFDFWPHSEGVSAAASSSVRAFIVRLIEVATEVHLPNLVEEAKLLAETVLSDSVADVRLI